MPDPEASVGLEFRIDTTVIETNVHDPTDSSLWQDGVRVLTRTMQRTSAALGDRPGRVHDRHCSVGRRVLIIVLMALVHVGRPICWQRPVVAPIGDLAGG